MLLRLAEEERESKRGEQSEFTALVLGTGSHREGWTHWETEETQTFTRYLSMREIGLGEDS